ncbi:hypothetical protein GW17_00033847 [Ensete ventricosum]|nr:hypothetical protein GW17_00033847 [Ensete ventricosum]
MAKKAFQVGLALAVMTIVLSALASAQSGCTTVIIGLAPCLSYITGNSSAPSSSCCSQLASVVKSQPACLCSVLDGGASSFGITINQTRALAMPAACKVQTPPVSECNCRRHSDPIPFPFSVLTPPPSPKVSPFTPPPPSPSKQSPPPPPRRSPPPPSPSKQAPPSPSKQAPPPPPPSPSKQAPPPPRRSPPPPSHSKKAPPPPPRKMAPPPPKLSPPPPPRTPVHPPPAPVAPLPPAPPHVPPPSPPPPSPHHTVIIVVFVSLGGLFFLAFLAAALCCCLKKKKKKMAAKAEVVDVEDHVHIHETVVPGPHGEQLVALSIDEDIKVHEVIKKGELIVETSIREPAPERPHPNDEATAGSSGTIHHNLVERRNQ